MIGVLFAAAVAGCVEITDNADAVLSLEFDSLPSPSVVIGDSLRDTTGAIAGPVVRAFNFQGEEIPAPAVRFHGGAGATSVHAAAPLGLRGDDGSARPVAGRRRGRQ